MAVEFAPLPPGPFATIVADPPWDYSNKMSGGGTSGYSPVHPSRGGNRGAANHYQTLSMEDLFRLPVTEVAAEKAHLYLWTTGAFIVEAHQLAEAWGFSPKGVIPWIKIKRDAAKHVQKAQGDLHAALRMGMGLYLRWASEFVVFAVRGKLPTLRDDVTGVVFGERRAHSQKPDELYRLVDSASPGPRLELFARVQRPDYEVWGDQVDVWQPPSRSANRIEDQGALFPDSVLRVDESQAGSQPTSV